MIHHTTLTPYALEFDRLQKDVADSGSACYFPSYVVSLIKIGLLILAIVSGLSVRSAAADTVPRLAKTQVVAEATSPIQRTFFGQIAARQTVDLGFQVGGRIVELSAPEGELLPQGTPIAQLDQEPFRIDVERARLGLEQAERTLNRFERLAGSTISESQVLDAQTEVRMAQVTLHNAEYALEQSVLNAPFDAIVATRNVANFSTVAPGTQVVRLHDLSELEVEIDVPEVLVRELGEDPDMTLTASLPGNDTLYPLTFREVKAETSRIGQTFRVTLAMETPDDQLLLPGASVTVHARLNQTSSAIRVPVSAVGTAPNGSAFVLEVVTTSDQPRLARKLVTLGVAASGDILVTDGLSPGAEIIIAGVNQLQDGDVIRRFDADFN